MKTTIANHWWLFLIVFAVILVLYAIALFIEWFKNRDDILKQHPLRIIVNILCLQAIYYAIYTYIVYTIDFMFQEVFYFTQIWTCYEFNFTTGRGWISIVSLILSFVSMTSVILAFVKERIYMRDYCFTLALGHFIVVSIVMLDFPYNGAWWFGMGLGLPLVIIPSEFICYQMELMPYKSHLGGKDKKSPSANSNNNKEQSQQQKQQKKPHQQPIPPLPIQQLKPDSLAEPIIQQSFGNGTISLEDIALEDAADAVPRSSPTTSLVRTPRTPPPQNSSPRSSPRLQHRRSSSISYHQHQQLH